MSIFPGEIIIIIISSLSLAVSSMTLLLFTKNNKKSNYEDSFTNNYQDNQFYNLGSQNSQQAYDNGTGNIVFCKKCFNQFDASQRVCPYCGTPR